MSEHEKLTLAAKKMGLSLHDVADILAKWGPTVLQLVVDGLEDGLSWKFIKDMLDAVGPLLLTDALNLRRRKASLQTVALPVASDLPDHFEGPAAGLLVDLIIKLLPTLIEKYGPQIIQLILDYLVKALQENGNKQKFTVALADALASK